jgi:DNA-binding winged helix-turn-helix (wHTH) protein
MIKNGNVGKLDLPLPAAVEATWQRLLKEKFIPIQKEKRMEAAALRVRIYFIRNELRLAQPNGERIWILTEHGRGYRLMEEHNEHRGRGTREALAR